MTEQAIGTAARLRRVWFEEVVPALETELPGAWEVLAMSSVELSDDGGLVARIPSLYPVLKPVHKLVKAAVLQGASALVPDLPVSVKFSAATPKTVRRHPSGRDVYHWGDPPPSAWPDLVRGLVAELAALDEPARSVLRHASVAALSQKVIWFCYPNADTRRAVGTTPGVAYALKIAVESWRPGSAIVSYAAA